MKRLGVLALALLAPLAGDSSARGVSIMNPGALVVGAVGEAASLDPVYPYDAVSQGLIYNVYDTLIAYEGETNDRLEPRLATEVPSIRNGLVSRDGLTYKFPIRPGVYFHDGTVLTAEDARYSLLRFMLTDPPGGPASLLLEPILGVSSTRDASGRVQVRPEDAAKAVAREGDAVVVHLKKPFAPFLSIMARWSYVMCRETARLHGEWDGGADTWQALRDRRADDSYFYSHVNGTGPFELERWDRQARRVYLKRFERYWRPPARLERVVVAAVPEFSTRKLMLEAGDLDIIETPRPYLSQLRGMPGVRVADGLPRLMTDPAFFFTFRINPVANPDIGSGTLDGDGIPPDFFSDLEVRKGFAYAFDYDAFLKETLKGAAKRAIGPIPPGLLGYNPRGPAYTHDLLRSAEHFQRAWGGKVWRRGFRFTLTYNKGGDVREAACQILKKNVEAVNPKFRVDLRGLEWPSFLDKAQKRMMPLFARGWTADYPDPHDFVFPFYHADGRYASAQDFRDAELVRMIDEAVRELDPVKRERLYWKIQERGFDLAPSIVTVHPVGVYAMRDWVKGFYDNAVFMGIYCYPLRKEAPQ